jgi:hypothetical protein
MFPESLNEWTAAKAGSGTTAHTPPWTHTLPCLNLSWTGSSLRNLKLNSMRSPGVSFWLIVHNLLEQLMDLRSSFLRLQG